MPPYPMYDRDSFIAACDVASAAALDWAMKYSAGSAEETAGAALGMQLNAYRFWTRQGWVDPFAVTGPLIAGRVPGMVLPGEPGYPFPMVPGEVRR